jgi:hypothetical protein
MYVPDHALALARENAVARTAFDRFAANPGQRQPPADDGLQFISEFGAFERPLGAGPDTQSMLACITAVVQPPAGARITVQDAVVGIRSGLSNGQGSRPRGGLSSEYLCIDRFPASPNHGRCVDTTRRKNLFNPRFKKLAIPGCWLWYGRACISLPANFRPHNLSSQISSSPLPKSASKGYVYMALSATGVIFLPTTARLAPQSGIERR